MVEILLIAAMFIVAAMLITFAVRMKRTRDIDKHNFKQGVIYDEMIKNVLEVTKHFDPPWYAVVQTVNLIRATHNENLKGPNVEGLKIPMMELGDKYGSETLDASGARQQHS
jgi:uncharacterized membrane protein YhaH (DUF805 family)